MAKLKKKRNKTFSISITPEQVEYIEEHPGFKFSQFVQLALNDYLNSAYEVERLEKIYNQKCKEVIIQ